MIGWLGGCRAPESQREDGNQFGRREESDRDAGGGESKRGYRDRQNNYEQALFELQAPECRFVAVLHKLRITVHEREQAEVAWGPERAAARYLHLELNAEVATAAICALRCHKSYSRSVVRASSVRSFVCFA